MQHDDPVDAGCRDILSLCADRLLAAIRRTRKQSNSSHLHQLRICARQLRQALGLFRDVIPNRERSQLDSDLRWLTRKTALARDHDVLTEEILDKIIGHDRDSGYHIAIRLISASQAQARHRTIRSLSSRRCRHIESNLKNFASKYRRLNPQEAARECDGQRQWRRTREPLISLARRGLCKHHKNPQQLSKSIRKLDLKTIHRLRIHIRAQHDRAKLLLSLFPQSAARRYVSALKRLQCELGAIHDLEVARELIHDLPESTRIRHARKRLEHQCEKLFCKRVIRLKQLNLSLSDLEPYWTDLP